MPRRKAGSGRAAAALRDRGAEPARLTVVAPRALAVRAGGRPAAGAPGSAVAAALMAEDAAMSPDEVAAQALATKGF